MFVSSKLALLDSVYASVEREREDLHPYQWEMHDFMRENPFSFIFVDMGLGKTVTSLTLIDTLMRDFDPYEMQHPLIVAPVRVASNTWPREIAKWRHSASWPWSLVRAEDDDPEVRLAYKTVYEEARFYGASPKEATQLAGRAAVQAKHEKRDRLRRNLKPITIINQEAVPWLVEAWGKKWPYDALFFDEAARLRDSDSKVFDSLRFVRPRFKRIHLLTATPAVQSLMPMFAMTYMLDGGERFGKFITHFRKKYFDENRYTHQFEEREGARAEMMAKIADIALVMKEEDYFDMEKPVFVPRFVTMTKEEQDKYDEFEEEMIYTTPEGCEIEAPNAASLAQKLLQLASGSVYDVKLEETEEEDVFKKVRNTHFIHQHKIEDLKTFIEEMNGKPVLLGYWSKASLVMLKKAFPKIEVLDRKASQEKRWNQGKIPLLAIHPDGGAHGLNLQDGGHHLYLFDLFHRAELYMQLVKRLARQGQKNVVKVHAAMTRGTLDGPVAEKLQMLEKGHHELMGLLTVLRSRIKAAKQRRRDRGVG